MGDDIVSNVCSFFFTENCRDIISSIMTVPTVEMECCKVGLAEFRFMQFYIYGSETKKRN